MTENQTDDKEISSSENEGEGFDSDEEVCKEEIISNSQVQDTHLRKRFKCLLKFSTDIILCKLNEIVHFFNIIQYWTIILW